MSSFPISFPQTRMCYLRLKICFIWEICIPVCKTIFLSMFFSQVFFFFYLSNGAVKVYSDNMISFVLFLNPNVIVWNNVCLCALAKRKQAGISRIERIIRELANPEYSKLVQSGLADGIWAADYIGQYHKTPRVRVSELCWEVTGWR